MFKTDITSPDKALYSTKKSWHFSYFFKDALCSVISGFIHTFWQKVLRHFPDRKHKFSYNFFRAFCVCVCVCVGGGGVFVLFHFFFFFFFFFFFCGIIANKDTYFQPMMKKKNKHREITIMYYNHYQRLVFCLTEMYRSCSLFTKIFIPLQQTLSGPNITKCLQYPTEPSC